MGGWKFERGWMDGGLHELGKRKGEGMDQRMNG